MWEKMKELWKYTNPASTNYGFMQEPLLTGEVWVAWDHTARLADAFNQQPDDFVAFPAPAGPAGRGFMPVVAGLGIPKTAPDMDGAKELITYMIQPDTQIATLKAIDFFPVVKAELPDDMPASVKAEARRSPPCPASKDANPGLLPVGLGDLGGKFNKVYTDTFERIVLATQDIKSVLDSRRATLRRHHGGGRRALLGAGRAVRRRLPGRLGLLPAAGGVSPWGVAAGTRSRPMLARPALPPAPARDALSRGVLPLPVRPGRRRGLHPRRRADARELPAHGGPLEVLPGAPQHAAARRRRRAGAARPGAGHGLARHPHGAGRDASSTSSTIPLGISDLAAGLIWLADLRADRASSTRPPQPRRHRPAGHSSSATRTPGDLPRRRPGRGVARHRHHDGDPRRRHGPHPARNTPRRPRSSAPRAGSASSRSRCRS